MLKRTCLPAHKDTKRRIEEGVRGGGRKGGQDTRANNSLTTSWRLNNVTVKRNERYRYAPATRGMREGGREKRSCEKSFPPLQLSNLAHSRVSCCHRPKWTGAFHSVCRSNRQMRSGADQKSMQGWDEPAQYVHLWVTGKNVASNQLFTSLMIPSSTGLFTMNTM